MSSTGLAVGQSRGYPVEKRPSEKPVKGKPRNQVRPSYTKGVSCIIIFFYPSMDALPGANKTSLPTKTTKRVGGTSIGETEGG